MLITFTDTGISDLLGSLSHDEQKRVAGIGISMPFQLWSWAEIVGAPEDEMGAWKNSDFRDELSTFTDLPVSVQSDATSACGAELVFGRGKELTDFVYFFIGTFIGGGIVLNHSLHPGRTGNAGVFGPMPLMNIDGNTTTLIDHASVFTL